MVDIVKIAHKYNIPIVPFSGGTSLEGHFDAHSFGKNEQTTAIPVEDLKPGPTLVLDFSANMNEIIKVNDKDMDVVVQPGMPYEQLNEELKEYKLFFPVDVGTISPPLICRS